MEVVLGIVFWMIFCAAIASVVVWITTKKEPKKKRYIVTGEKANAIALFETQAFPVRKFELSIEVEGKVYIFYVDDVILHLLRQNINDLIGKEEVELGEWL